jgi:flagellar biosynthesis protein
MTKLTGKKTNVTVTKAVALKYDGENAPKLVAKGERAIAEEIVSIAEQNDVHVHYDPLLLNVLAKLELGDEIPEALYLSVAKIIAFAYYLQGKHPDNNASTSDGIKNLVDLSAGTLVEKTLKDNVAPSESKENSNLNNSSS